MELTSYLKLVAFKKVLNNWYTAYKGKWSLDRIALDRNCVFSVDQNF